MPRSKKAVSPRTKKAALLLNDNPNLSIPDATRAAKFTEEGIRNSTNYKRVQRQLKDIRPPVVVQREPQGNQPVSPMTTTTTSNSSLSIMSSEKSSSSKKKPKVAGVKDIRKTASQAQQDRMNKGKIKTSKKAATKEATKLYAIERPKSRSDKSKKGAREICEAVNEKRGTTISSRTVEELVQKGIVGVSPPLNNSHDGGVPWRVFKTLKGAFESYVQIKQINGDGGSTLSKKNLSRQVNHATATDDEDMSRSERLLNRLLRDTEIDLKADIQNPIEDRRRRWTTYANLKLWFDVWEDSLLEFGFAVKEDGKLYISEESLARIINLDESCLSLDGSDGKRGGRPTISFHNPCLPDLGKCASKSSVTATFIGGSNAKGEALPPHIQLSTSAKSDERQKFRVEMLEHLHNIVGNFGHETEQSFPVTIGMNEKGGMDDDQFAKYLLNLISAIFPDCADKRGRRVIINIDSGPGRTNVELLARLQMMGVYLYPGVPNTTSVSQETDRNYGVFKSIYRENIEMFAYNRERCNMSTTPNMAIVGLFIFGGPDSKTRCNYKNAFEAAFSKEKCLEAWEKVGAAPLTRACLCDTKVRHEVGADEDDDPLAGQIRKLQEQNDLCVAGLNSFGCRGSFLAATLKEKHISARAKLTLPQSDERVKALAVAKTHGERFVVTGGSHLNSDDAFKAVEMSVRKTQLNEAKANKKKRQMLEKRDTEARNLLTKTSLNGTDCGKLLTWYGVDRKNLSAQQNKAKWSKFIDENRPEPTFEKWTDADEAAMKDLESTDFSLKDTALGRLKTARRIEFEADIASMTQEERAEYLRELNPTVGTAVDL